MREPGAPWPQGQRYGEFLRTLDRSDPRHLALIHEATALFRGAGYTPFDGAPPEHREHAAVANPYAHVTAPLRRLVDRFGLVVCEALSAGTDVPAWARAALPTELSEPATKGQETFSIIAVTRRADGQPLVEHTLDACGKTRTRVRLPVAVFRVTVPAVVTDQRGWLFYGWALW